LNGGLKREDGKQVLQTKKKNEGEGHLCRAVAGVSFSSSLPSPSSFPDRGGRDVRICELLVRRDEEKGKGSESTVAVGGEEGKAVTWLSQIDFDLPSLAVAFSFLRRFE